MSQPTKEWIKLHAVFDEVETEFFRATTMYGTFNSAHEGYAVLKEEVDELWDDIKNNAPLTNQRKEAIQVAAMAIRYILDVTGGPWVKSSQKDDIA